MSSYNSGFNHDFGVSFTPERALKGRIIYNYGKWPLVGEEWPSVSAFYKDDSDNVSRTYSAYRRRVEVMMGTYRVLELTPQGHAERDDTIYKMEWVRHHDRYEPEPVVKAMSADASCRKAHAQGGLS